MNEIFLFHIVLLGLGYWNSKLFFKFKPYYGISYFLSLPFLIIILYLGNILFSLPLVFLSQIVFCFAAFGLFFLIRSKDSLRQILAHPVFYILPIVGIYFFITPESIYSPTSWDEYSMWLRRPMEIVLDNAILNPARHGYGKGYTYTPAANLLLAYPNLLLDQTFSIAHTIKIPLVSAAALLGLAYDIVRTSIPKNIFIPGILIFTGLFSTLAEVLYPANVLIESFMHQSILAMGLCVYAYLKGKIKGRKGLLLIGVVGAYAYLIKAPSALLMPGLMITLYLYHFNNWRITNKSYPVLIRRAVIDAFLLAGPFVLVACLWEWDTQGYAKNLNFWRGENSLNLWQERAYLAPKLLKSFLYYFSPSAQKFGIWGTISFAIALLGFIWAAWHRHQRYFSLFLISFVAIYSFLITWLYRTTLGSWEADRLSSFGRYMEIAYIPILFFGLLIVLSNSLPYIDQLSTKVNLSKNFTVLIKFILCWNLFLCLSALGVFLLFSAGDLAHQQYVKLRSIPFDPISAKIDVLADEVSKRNLAEPRVYLITQGSNTSEVQRASFYSIKRNELNNMQLKGGRSIGTKKTNLWSIVLDKESTKQMLLENDIIWIEKHDSYIDEILAKIIDQSTCKTRFRDYFLFKTASNKFECGTPQNPSKNNCEILNKRSGIESGIHEMDPDGYGPLPPIKTVCKIEAGIAWTLVAKISDKNSEHAQYEGVNIDEFYQDGKFGKLDDPTIQQLNHLAESKLECGDGEYKSIFIKVHLWRSFVNHVAYGGFYSIDRERWFPFKERGIPSWNGFDNYGAANKNNHPFFAYHIGRNGCYAAANGDRAAKGALWVR